MNQAEWLNAFLVASGEAAGIGTLDGWRPLSLLVEAGDEINWLLIILSIEVELKVDIPDSLADGADISVSEFIARVVALPRVTNPFWTFDRFSVLERAFQAADEEVGGVPS